MHVLVHEGGNDLLFWPIADDGAGPAAEKAVFDHGEDGVKVEPKIAKVHRPLISADGNHRQPASTERPNWYGHARSEESANSLGVHKHRIWSEVIGTSSSAAAR